MAEEEVPEVEPPKAEPKAPPVKEAPEAEEKLTGKSTELIDKANEAAERLERANKQREALIIREEALKVTETLGGKSEAGTKPKEQSPEDYAKKVMAGEVDAKPK